MFEMERLHCNACVEVFTPDEPETAGPAKYDETAIAMIALDEESKCRSQPHREIFKPPATPWQTCVLRFLRTYPHRKLNRAPTPEEVSNQ
jgi:hypothetical protein